MKSRYLLLLLPLAGCTAGGTGPEAACQRQAVHDPKVEQLIAIQSGSDWLRINGRGALAQAKKEAYLRCMQKRGLIPPGGGVQPVIPPSGYSG